MQQRSVQQGLEEKTWKWHKLNKTVYATVICATRTRRENMKVTQTAVYDSASMIVDSQLQPSENNILWHTHFSACWQLLHITAYSLLSMLTTTTTYYGTLTSQRVNNNNNFSVPETSANLYFNATNSNKSDNCHARVIWWGQRSYSGATAPTLTLPVTLTLTHNYRPSRHCYGQPNLWRPYNWTV